MRAREPIFLQDLLNVMLTKRNAVKFAHDLGQLQAYVYRQTKISDYADVDDERGHTTAELGKFGHAVEMAIKEDLRAHPKKSLVKFYVNVLQACHDMKNYELVARVYAGIDGAIKKDEPVHKPGERVYEYPPEDPKVTNVREKVKKSLSEINNWQALNGFEFPAHSVAMKSYRQYMEEKVSFVPTVATLMYFINMWLTKAEIGSAESKQDKLRQLKKLKDDIYDDLFLIMVILKKQLPLKDESLPEKQKLYFPQLEEYFAESLKLNLQPSGDLDDVLDKLLKIDVLEAALEKDAAAEQEAKAARAQGLFQSPREQSKTPRTPVTSPRETIKTPRSARGTILKESVYESPRKVDEEISPRTKEPANPVPLSPKKK